MQNDKSTNPILVFDLGGVVINHNIPRCIRLFRELLGSNLHVLGLQDNGEAAGITTADVADAAASISPTLMSDFELGYIDTDGFVSALLPLCQPGTTREQILEAWDAMHGDLPAERLDMLRRSHETHYQYALSNNNEEHWSHLHRFCPDFDSYFDALFASHLLHVAKPDPGIFLAAEKVIRQQVPDYTRSRVIFVDDLEANRLAAERFGWSSAPSMEELFQQPV